MDEGLLNQSCYGSQTKLLSELWQQHILVGGGVRSISTSLFRTLILSAYSSSQILTETVIRK